MAHAEMLGKQSIIPAEAADRIVQALGGILADAESGRIEWDVKAEDIHMNVEKLLTERIGDAGKMLHTGRSRNDQVALDTRMYVRDRINEIDALLKALIITLCDIARKHTNTAMPGFTHMQKAQPITLAFHMLAYCEMFLRDRQRLMDTYKRVNVLPLGSGALAGTTYPLDREFVADRLGFTAVSRNALDAVSDRDFCIEFASAASIIMMHLSRFCEEIITWASDEYRFAELDDAYSTGSSIMPQKKNPDPAELIRGKTGRVYGSLVSLLAMMKSLPLAYNKDMQEDKEQVFNAADTVCGCLQVFTGMVSTMRFNTERMKRSCGTGFINATDAADYLAKKGVAFRNAHEIIGKLVLYCIEQSKTLEELSLDEYRVISPVFDDDIYEAVSLSACIAARNIYGGPAAERTETAIDEVMEQNRLLSRRDNTEIERKFLVDTAACKSLLEQANGIKRAEIAQAYISFDPVIRIRKADNAYYLTVKGHRSDSGIINAEHEIPITSEQYEALLSRRLSGIVSKTRYYLPLSGGHTAEIDIYHESLNGLVTVEVEFDSEAEAEAFIAPEWFGKDVSDDPAYKNSSLSKR